MRQSRIILAKLRPECGVGFFGLALARHNGTMVVHDFAYADLGFDGYKPPSILQVEGAKDVAEPASTYARRR